LLFNRGDLRTDARLDVANSFYTNLFAGKLFALVANHNLKEGVFGR